MGQIACRLDVAAVDVDRVVDRFEGVKRDADRQNHLQHRQRRSQAEGAGRLRERAEEEVGILEVAEQAEVAGEAGAEQQLADARAGCGLHAAGDEVVGQRRDAQHEGQPVVPARVEINARREQQQHAAALPGHGPVGAEDNQEEDAKSKRAEQQGQRPWLELSWHRTAGCATRRRRLYGPGAVDARDVRIALRVAARLACLHNSAHLES